MTVSFRAAQKGAGLSEYILLLSAGVLVGFGVLPVYLDRLTSQYQEAGLQLSSAVDYAVAHQTIHPFFTYDFTAPPDPDLDEFATINIDIDCSAYSALDFGFPDDSYGVVVPGTLLGTFTDLDMIEGDAPEITVDGITPFGDAASHYYLSIDSEEAIAAGYFADKTKLSVYTIEGDRLLNNAMVRYFGEGDLSQGDEHLITATKDLVIDLHGFSPDLDALTYNPDYIAGNLDFGNNNGLLDFSDLGCIVITEAACDPSTFNANNGHGNNCDKNDDSNPGASNDPDDVTDNDGNPNAKKTKKTK